MHSKYLSLIPLLAANLLLLPAAWAADIENGKALHEANCTKCHDSGVYTRNDRKVDSLSALERQVKRCELSLGLTWFDEQVADVVQYLNATYYNFK